VSLQSRDTQQLLGKFSKLFFCNWRGEVFRAAAARRDRVSKWRLHSKRRSVCCRIQNAAAARNTILRQLQTNFDSFPNNCWISHDCRLTGYSIINMWKCYLLFELLCIPSLCGASNLLWSPWSLTLMCHQLLYPLRPSVRSSAPSVRVLIVA
jgi:hypothetical protein